MMMRELSKPGQKRNCQLYLFEFNVIEYQPDGCSCHFGQSDLQAATQKFESLLKQYLGKGWVETEHSFSRRVFFHTQKSPGKFWIVSLNDQSLNVQYGKEPKHARHWSDRQGQSNSKDFPTREQALQAYTKLVAEKLVEGYEERYARTTDYSELGQDLAKKKLAAPKVVRKAKEVPAEVNLAKMLTDRPESEVHTEITHRIDLNPADWFWATWKSWKPLTREKPAPFDQEACVQRASAVTNLKPKWIERLQIPQVMTLPEAHFWFTLLVSAKKEGSPADAAKKLAKKPFDGKLDPSKLKGMKDYLDGEVSRLVSFLISPEQLLESYLSLASDNWSHNRFRENVLPYCTAAEIKRLRSIVASKIDVNVQPKKGHWNYYPQAVYFGTVLGCHDQIRQIIQSWPTPDAKGAVPFGFYRPDDFLFSLGSAREVEAEARRLKVKWHRPHQLRAWLATTEFQALDVVRDSILAVTNKELCDELLGVFSLVKAPEVAVHMLDISLHAKSPRLAREWLQTEVGNAVAGLIPVAVGQSKLAEAAMSYLREKNREGHAAVIAGALKGLPGEIAKTIQEQVLNCVEKVVPEFTDKTSPAWLMKATSLAARQQPIPGANFVQVSRLPAIVVQDSRLNLQQVASVLLALQHAQPGEAGGLLSDLKQHAEPESLDAFAWALFQQWLAETAPPKHKWAMRALGILGSDSVVLKLTPLIRAWPGESQHPRAVLGLECLRAIGTDLALMQLNGIAVKLKFKALQNKAREFMEAIAAEKGLSAAQLEDRIVPDCDLDQRGTRILDFGSRQFQVILGGDLKPVLKDSEGKVKADLPKPGSKDDSAKAADAINVWKLLKKQLKDVAVIQALRLEQAMVTGRRWTTGEFETLLVKHPLMTNLARLLLWSGYNSKGQPIASFRVTDDQKYADQKDQDFKLDKIETIGIAHPLHLTDEQKSAWGEIFGDYEIIPPFPQLGRPVFTLNKSELSSDKIGRFDGIKIPATTLVFGLEKLGWTRGLAQDNGQVNGHSKYFPSSDQTAVVIFEDGVPTGYRDGWEDQQITDVYFVPGQHRVTWGRRWSKTEKAIPLKKLDTVIVSEVLNDLTGLAAKGQ